MADAGVDCQSKSSVFPWFDARPEWPFLHEDTLAFGAPAAVAIERDGRRRRSDAPQDLPRGRGMIGVSMTAARRMASAGIEQHLRQPSRRSAGSFASVHGAVAAMNSFVASSSAECRRRALVQQEAVHRSAVVDDQLFAEPDELIGAAPGRTKRAAAIRWRPSRRRGSRGCRGCSRGRRCIARRTLPSRSRRRRRTESPSRDTAAADRRRSRSAASIGSTIVPSDLLIRWPPSVRKPWPNTWRGSGSSALISIAGQITAWKRVMSLPMTCRSAGHHRSNICAIGAEADRRRVVDQRVEPDVDDARRIERQRDAPRLPGAADRDVLEPAFDQPQDLVAPDVGLQELGMRGEVIEQRLLILRQPEEVVLLA